MGNQISQQLENDYRQYLESSNEILTGMAVNLNSKSVQEIQRIPKIGSRNSHALYLISYIIHFLYGKDESLTPPFDPPAVDTTMVGQLCYDMKLVTYLRETLFNEDNSMDVIQNPDASNMEKLMFRNLITYLELVKVVTSVLEKYKGLEFFRKSPQGFDFDNNYVDFKTTVEIEEFIASPVQLPRNSASDSIVFRGMWKQKWVYVKTFDKDNQALLYEKEIYRYIKSKISSMDNTFQDVYKRHFIIPKFVCQYGKAGRIANVTEDSGGISVQNLTQKVNITVNEYLAIIFQVLYLVGLMNMIGISHNDVHLGNIIATPRKPGDKPFQEFNYHGQNFDISPYGTMYNCKIYDFDRASSILQENRSLIQTGLCREFGQCNRKDSEKDAFNTLMLIHMFKPQDPVMTSFHNILWEEMARVNQPAANELKTMILENLGEAKSWQTYCSSNRGIKCEFTTSPLMDISVFLDIYCKAVKKLS